MEEQKYFLNECIFLLHIPCINKYFIIIIIYYYYCLICIYLMYFNILPLLVFGK